MPCISDDFSNPHGYHFTSDPDCDRHYIPAPRVSLFESIVDSIKRLKKMPATAKKQDPKSDSVVKGGNLYEIS